MSETIIGIIISGVLTIIANAIVTNSATKVSDAVQTERIEQLKEMIKTNNDEQSKKIEALAEKVESHNTYGIKIAKLETRIEILEKGK